MRALIVVILGTALAISLFFFARDIVATHDAALPMCGPGVSGACNNANLAAFADPSIRPRPNKGDAQRCIIDEWFRQHDPKSIYLPENGWHNQGEIPCP